MSLFTRSTELKRFREGALPKIALVVLLVIPLIYGALYLWAFWAPTDNLNKLPVAIVNLDEPAEKPDGTMLAAGDDVVEQLQEGEDLAWRPLGADAAARAVGDGDVYFSVTIPRDFSSTLAGLQDDPKAGEIEVVYNDNNSFLASTLGKQAMVQLRDAVAETATQTAAEQVLVGVEKLSDGTRTAAKAAGTLETGTSAVADGSEKLTAGLGELADGTSQLAAQAPALVEGTGRLASGADRARDGSAQLAEGSGRLSDGATQLSSGAAQLDAKLGEAQTGSTRLREGMDRLAAQAPTLAGGVQSALTGSQQLAGGVASAQSGAASLSGALGQVAALAGENPDMTLAQLDAALAQQGASLAGLAGGAQQLSDGLTTASSGAQTLSDGLSRLNDGLAGLPAQAAEAQSGAANLEQGLAALKGGSATLASKSGELAGGAQTLSSKTGELAAGAQQLSDGANELASKTPALAAGAQKLDAGAQQASERSGELAAGAGKVSEGSSTFASKLADGAAEAPSFERGQTAKISETMAAPVQLAEHTENEVQGFGEGFAPFFIALASFVGALITWLILRPLPHRPLASNVSGFRTVLTGFWPAALIGVGQVAIMMAVLVFGIGMRPAHWMGMAAFMLLVTLAFLALQQMFIALLGTATGRVVSLVLLMLMLSSSGGTYPVETTPAFFQALHPFMPASYVVEGLRQLIGGGIDARFWGALLVMAGVLVGSLAISAVAARRQKVWTVKRLHPSLAI
ncbi:YhgE/Pip family protein [Leucobacter ruminantium]|uniref:YhgE/Pip domain-containing protein n=1 Tax=Leucobacter ruminantium TaxID=1289170 RepID=A0A939M214_9MICO|nr:YhgE/Pip domain-containing protein [Leucobacter ruminantium]MBO1805590.1 YhgE/Pip domain-containing protein [Leucobacter ruminantium]